MYHMNCNLMSSTSITTPTIISVYLSDTYIPLHSIIAASPSPRIIRRGKFEENSKQFPDFHQDLTMEFPLDFPRNSGL